MAERGPNGQFLPGHSGGPGRPKKGECAQDLLAKHLPPEELAKTIADRVLKEGEPWAIRLAAEYLWGKPVAKHEVTGTDGEPLQVVHVIVDTEVEPKASQHSSN